MLLSEFVQSDLNEGRFADAIKKYGKTAALAGAIGLGAIHGANTNSIDTTPSDNTNIELTAPTHATTDEVSLDLDTYKNVGLKCLKDGKLQRDPTKYRLAKTLLDSIELLDGLDTDDKYYTYHANTVKNSYFRLYNYLAGGNVN